MAISFCDKCGKPLKIQTIDGKTIGTCSCGFKKEAMLFSSENIQKVKKGKGVFNEKKKQVGFPHKCPKCGYDKSEATDLGAAYSDEANICLFRCKKCGHVKRQADGSSNR